jgi:hypothetical protein
MPDDTLRPATAHDIEDALAYALRFDGRRRTHQADDLMARITAQRLVRHMALCGFAVSHQPKRWGDTGNIGSGPKTREEGES